MTTLRRIMVALLLAIETIVSTPIFLLSWYACAVLTALQSGWLFARMEYDGEKRRALSRILGGGNS